MRRFALRGLPLLGPSLFILQVDILQCFTRPGSKQIPKGTVRLALETGRRDPKLVQERGQPSRKIHLPRQQGSDTRREETAVDERRLLLGLDG